MISDDETQHHSDSPVVDETEAAAARGGPSPVQYGSDDSRPWVCPEAQNSADKSFYDDELSGDEATPDVSTARPATTHSAPISQQPEPELDEDGFPVYNPDDFGDEPQDAGWGNYDDANLIQHIAGLDVAADDRVACIDKEEFDVAYFDLDYDNPYIEKIEYVGKQPWNTINRIVDDSFLETDEPGAVSRLVVIDAANILHGLTPICEGHTVHQTVTQKVDACYILSLVAFFVRKKGIECVVVMQHKYMLDKVTDNVFILRALQEMGLLMVMDRTYDDLVLFSVAAEFDAVILTEDQFKSERADAEFMKSPNVQNSLKLRVSPRYPRKEEDFLPREERYSVTRNGHFVVDHLMRFEGSPDNLRKKFFSTAARGGHRFELVQEKHESWLRRREQVQEALEALLASVKPLWEQMREDVIALVPRWN